MSYFNDLPLEGKMALKAEFENPETARERKIELLEILREGANESQMSEQCSRCENYLFFAPNNEGLIEGHVYTEAGLVEVDITGYCEFCFDLITREPEEE